MICSNKCKSLDITIIFVYGLQVPADTVVNATLCIISYHTRAQSGLIYHIGSSMRNPLEIVELLHTMFRYFTEMVYRCKGRGNQGEPADCASNNGQLL
jgi:hypothetical protein